MIALKSVINSYSPFRHKYSVIAPSSSRSWWGCLPMNPFDSARLASDVNAPPALRLALIVPERQRLRQRLRQRPSILIGPSPHDASRCQPSCSRSSWCGLTWQRLSLVYVACLTIGTCICTTDPQPRSAISKSLTAVLGMRSRGQLAL